MFNKPKGVKVDDLNLDDIDFSLEDKEVQKDFLESLSPENRQRLELIQLKQKRGRALIDRYEDDVVGYVVNVLGHRPWQEQANLLLNYQHLIKVQKERHFYQLGELNRSDLTVYEPGMRIKKYLSVDAGHNIGKCVAENDLIQLAEGWVVPARELVNQKFNILSLDNGRPIVAKAFATFNKKEEVFTIETETGVSITRNAEHPFYVEGEWKRTEQLEVGDKLRFAPTLPAFNDSDVTDLITVQLLAFFSTLSIPLETFNLKNIEDKDYVQQYLPSVFFIPDESILIDFSAAIQSYDTSLGFQKVDGAEDLYKIITFDEQNVINVSNSTWPRVFCELHGFDVDNPNEMGVPQTALSGSRYNVLNYLKTCFRAIALFQYESPEAFDFTIIHPSETFIDGINFMLRRFGVVFKKEFDSEMQTWKLYLDQDLVYTPGSIYIKSFSNFCDIILEREDINAEVYFHTCNVGFTPDDYEPEVLNGMYSDRIVSIESAGIQETVSITVPETSTFFVYHYEHNTASLAYIANHYLDMYESMIYAFAPTFDQIINLFFREFRKLRNGAGLPGQILENGKCKLSDNNRLICRAASDSSGTGTEKAQGLHNLYQLHLLDEAEGLPPFLFEAIESMISGGISLVVVSRNPKTTSCAAHLIREKPDTESMTISSLDHPNVIHDKPLIPGAISRDYIRKLLDECEIVDEHNLDKNTVEIDWIPGVIFQPTNMFMWRVLGIASGADAGDKVMSVAFYNTRVLEIPGTNRVTFNPHSASFKNGDYRDFELDEDYWREADLETIQIGIDCARFGDDNGTIYINWAGFVWREAAPYQERGLAYSNYAVLGVQRILKFIDYLWYEILNHHRTNPPRVYVSFRVDGDGGFGSTVVDHILEDEWLDGEGINYEVYEVLNNSSVEENEVYDNFVTMSYFKTKEELEYLTIINPPETLRTDLCLRKWETVVKMSKGVFLAEKIEPKRLQKKLVFRREHKRSPDDGDGCVLACVPEDYLHPFAATNSDTYLELGNIENYTNRWV